MPQHCDLMPAPLLVESNTPRPGRQYRGKQVRYLFFLALFVLHLLLTGCAPDAFELMPVMPKQLQPEEEVTKNVPKVLVPEKAPRWRKRGPGEKTQFSETPTVQGSAENPLLAPDVIPVPLLADKKVTVNFTDMPLPAFINNVYGDILNLSFTLPPDLKDRKDLVSLRSKEDITLTELYSLATEIIGQYGVEILIEDNLLKFVFAGNRPDEVPLLISGRTLPQVPRSHRPVFQLIELHVVKNTMVAQWLRVAFKNQSLEIFEDPRRDAILLKGNYELVQLASEMVIALDQPHMRGRYSFRVDPVFLKATTLADKLTEILKAEGIIVDSSTGPVILIPVKEVNALLVFAADEQMLKHIRTWVTSLDKPGEMVSTGEQSSGIFSYQVRNTTADTIGSVLNQVIGDIGMVTLQDTKNLTAAAGVTSEAAAAATAAAAADLLAAKKMTDKIIVDAGRNMILYQGSSAKWNQILTVIRSLDQMDRMVLLEVIIAEITLDNEEDLGINWSITSGDTSFGTAPINGESDGGLPLGASGFSFLLDTAGGIFARFNAYAKQNKLAILSTPRLMVKNGTAASIEVGKEVPYISRAISSTNVDSNDSTGIVSETQYKKTGILLSVTPTIFSGNRVQLNLTQEASETTPDETNNTGSPSIFNRQINTTLTLKDGASVLLGGLITTQHSSSREGVPWFMDIPLLGSLFRVSGASGTRTELVMMIIPYIVNSDQEAKSLTRAYLDRLSYKPDQSHIGKKNMKLN